MSIWRPGQRDTRLTRARWTWVGGCDVRIRYVDLNSMQTHYAFFHTSLETSPVTNQMHWVRNAAIAE